MTLTGITWDHPRGYDPLVASSALYKKLFGVKVEWQKRSLTNFGDQSLDELAQRFDLLVIDHPHVGVAHETQCLSPLNKVLPAEKIRELKKQTAGPSFTSYSYKRKQWALPVDAAMQCSAMRKDLLIDFAVPKNWDQVFELTASLKKRKLHVGIALCPTDSLCTLLTLTAQLGSPIKEGNERLVSRNVGMKSLELMRRMRDSFHINSLDWNPIQLYDYMSTNDDVVYSPLAFCYSNYTRDGFRKKKLSYHNAPGIANALLGGAGIAVSAKTIHPVEAAKYAGWVCSSSIQNSVYVAKQGQPANLVALRSEFANSLTGNFFLNTFDTLRNAFIRPRYSGWPKFQKYLGERIHAYLKQDAEPVKILKDIQEAYRQSYSKNTD
jgi:multiple sugar transport system substrate-binding protein